MFVYKPLSTAKTVTLKFRVVAGKKICIDGTRLKIFGTHHPSFLVMLMKQGRL